MLERIKLLTSLMIIALSSNAQQDWSPTNMHSAVRYDDVFFINASTGWAAGGNSYQILHTKDSGTTWELQFSAGKYLRSIEFATKQLGFCGSLDGSLYKTTNGGTTWSDISHLITPKPAGICGLSAPDSSTIYGCGIWRSPAFVVKSVDGGQTWSYTDMSAYAAKLVDIYFINKDTGFVTGTANPVTDGGIILYTTDGGKSWQVKYKTHFPEDYIWKIQSPDNVHFFGSVNSLPSAANTRMLKSADKGLNWSTVVVKNTFNDVEMIGFMDRNTGWTGGKEVLFKTIDGGMTWSEPQLPYKKSFNKFFRVNNRVAYLSGDLIYRYKGPYVPPLDATSVERHSIIVSPNPTKGNATANIVFANNTYANLALYTLDGKKLQQFIDRYIAKGIHTINMDLTRYQGSSYFLVLKTNEGQTHQKIVKLSD